MSFFFRAAYLIGFKPWDSGVPPPELTALVEGTDHLPPSKALDLGCGTGTNSIYLAQHGWEVTGVDVVGRAVSQARRKVAAAGVVLAMIASGAFAISSAAYRFKRVGSAAKR